MTKLSDMQKAGRIKIAFDRAGTSNASEEDKAVFASAALLQEQGMDPSVWKKLIKDTKWFQTYCGAVKKAMMMEAQDYEGALDVICIHGGSITQVEQEEMPRLLGEASA